jgi:hypothetical protein
MPNVGKIRNNVGRTITGALVGGTISEATGGKFANGAVSGAIQAAMMGGDGNEAQEGEWSAQDEIAEQQAANVYGEIGETGGMLKDLGVAYSPKDGFAAALTRPDLDGPYYLSFRGSEGAWNNWKNNFRQALGLRSSQYDQAGALARDVMKATGGNVIFVGHSLGGGLASAAAYATGGRAITFNAAGLSSRYSVGMPGDIRAHYIRGDILTSFQRWTPFPNAAGMPIPHAGFGNPLARHALEQFP